MSGQAPLTLSMQTDGLAAFRRVPEALLAKTAAPFTKMLLGVLPLPASQPLPLGMFLPLPLPLPLPLALTLTLALPPFFLILIVRRSYGAGQRDTAY